jgi:hypothetical protein
MISARPSAPGSWRPPADGATGFVWLPLDRWPRVAAAVTTNRLHHRLAPVLPEALRLVVRSGPRDVRGNAPSNPHSRGIQPAV